MADVTEIKETKRSKVSEFIENNGELIAVGGTIAGFVLLIAGGIVGSMRQDAMNKEIADKWIDANLEASKYAADKKAEVELGTATSIRDIVHDITTLKKES